MAKETKTRTSIIVDPQIAQNIKFIGLFEHQTMQDIITKQLLNFIQSWKKAHPDVKFPSDPAI